MRVAFPPEPVTLRPNWVESGGKTSKDSLMTGRGLGFKGTWGVDYSKNLRVIADREGERIPRSVRPGKEHVGQYIDLKVVTADTVKKP